MPWNAFDSVPPTRQSYASSASFVPHSGVKSIILTNPFDSATPIDARDVNMWYEIQISILL